MTAIYSLIDPIFGEVRYIGKTDDPIPVRLKKHLREWRSTRCKHTRKNRWIASLMAQGLKPIAKMIEIVPQGADWQEYERLWIAKFRKLNDDLIVNFTDGGQGPKGHKHSQEARRKLSAFFKGRPNLAIVGHEVSLETRSKLSKALAGRKIQPIGYKHSPETLAKMSAAKIGKKLPAELCRKLSELRKGKQLSPETRKRMSEAAKRRLRTDTGKAQWAAARTKRSSVP